MHDIEEVNCDFDYAHSITANGNYYNYVSYFDVEKSIQKCIMIPVNIIHMLWIF